MFGKQLFVSAGVVAAVVLGAAGSRTASAYHPYGGGYAAPTPAYTLPVPVAAPTYCPPPAPVYYAPPAPVYCPPPPPVCAPPVVVYRPAYPRHYGHGHGYRREGIHVNFRFGSRW